MSDSGSESSSTSSSSASSLSPSSEVGVSCNVPHFEALMSHGFYASAFHLNGAAAVAAELYSLQAVLMRMADQPQAQQQSQSQSHSQSQAYSHQQYQSLQPLPHATGASSESQVCFICTQ
jgi:hypothetical protein